MIFIAPGQLWVLEQVDRLDLVSPREMRFADLA
jgi:hypothetical protein